MECWQDVPDLGDPIAESLGDPSINGSGATPAPTFLLGFQSWGCHLAGSGDTPPRPNVPGTYTPHVCNPWTYSTLHHSACRPPPVPHTVMCTPYAVLPYCRTPYATPPVRHTVPYCRTPYAVRRTAVRRTPYAVRRTPYAVPAVCRTPYAVRRTTYCRTAVRRTAVLPYAVLPYSHTAVRRTAVRRTPCAVLLYGQWESSGGYGHQVLRLSVEKSTLMALLTIRKSSDSEKAILILLHMTPACEKPQVLRSQAS